MDIKDQITQKHFPTVMVPKYGTLESCPLYKTRLLMARDGLYLDTLQPLGAFTTHLWQAPRELPYGPIEPNNALQDELFLNPSIHEIFANNIMPEVTKHTEQNLEWAGWITWNPNEGYQYCPLNFVATPARVYITERPILERDTFPAIDVHSHVGSPFFSYIDDRDDFGGVRLSVVIGSHSPGTFIAESRLIVEGFYLDVEGNIIEGSYFDQIEGGDC